MCYGGRINTSCQCDCYDGLFSGENCTGELHACMHTVVCRVAQENRVCTYNVSALT